jgi:putative protease
MNHTLPSPELLAPAGNLEKLHTAIRYGADAVYLGGQALNLRASTQGIALEDLSGAVRLAHDAGTKVYFTMNILAREHHLAQVREYLERLPETGVDGVIIADPGVLALSREIAPDLPVHLSTQANTSNSMSIGFWQDLGVSRVNLARELSCRDIRAARKAVPDMELEVFVHGAMCMAVSGHCLLSAFLNNRSGNLGQCSHPCRFEYRPVSMALEEELRPGEVTWEVEQGGEFTKIMAAEDLCLAPFLAWFRNVGITSLKIEGRMKTSAYLAQVVDVYRTALSDLEQGTFRPGLYLDELRQTVTRPAGSGFFAPKRRTFLTPPTPEEKKSLVGLVAEPLGPGAWRVQAKNRWDHGPVELLLPGLRRPVLETADYGLEKETGEAVSVLHPGTWGVLHCDRPELETGFFVRSHS